MLWVGAQECRALRVTRTSEPTRYCGLETSTWLLFVATEAALCFSPGPPTIYVTSQALSRGLRLSIVATLGVVTGNSVYFLASALGLGVLILASHQLFLIIKWIGVAYLVWLGMRMVLGTTSMLSAQPSQSLLTRRVFQGGVILQLANPTNLIFFLAILPPFIDPTGNVLLQVLILGTTSQILHFAALLFYGSLASRAGGWVRASRFKVWVDRVAGSLLISIGTGLAFVRRASP